MPLHCIPPYNFLLFWSGERHHGGPCECDWTSKCPEIPKQLNKQTNKQTNKQASKQASKQTSKQASKQTNKQTNKQTDRQTNRQTDRQTNRQTDTQTDKQTPCCKSDFPGAVIVMFPLLFHHGSAEN